MLLCRKIFSEEVFPRFKAEFYVDNNIDLVGRGGGLAGSSRSPVFYVQDCGHGYCISKYWYFESSNIDLKAQICIHVHTRLDYMSKLSVVSLSI